MVIGFPGCMKLEGLRTFRHMHGKYSDLNFFSKFLLKLKMCGSLSIHDVKKRRTNFKSLFFIDAVYVVNVSLDGRKG
jgi:hypothetical protein